MKARLSLVVVALAATFVLAGCMVSAQDGQRGHYNSPHPKEIAFHFDTGFNRAVVWGRGLALVGLGLCVVHFAGPARRMAMLVAVTLPLASVGAWLVHDGLQDVSSYRIEVLPDRLHLSVPGEPVTEHPWDSIEGLLVEGTELQIRTGVRALDSLPDFEMYTHFELHLKDGSLTDVDLRPLSPEQRGTLWQAVVRMAGLVQQ